MDKSCSDPLFATVAALAGSGALDVVNARGEFACNSSSSHSIVVLPPTTELVETSPEGEFGWSAFTLTDSASKLRYLAAMLAAKRGPEHTIAAQLRAKIGDGWSTSDYVDHESVLDFPRGRDGRVDTQFLSEFAECLTSPRVAVLGGNDNDGAHPLEGKYPTLWGHSYGAWRTRRDAGSGGDHWWVLFNDHDGTKLRLRLTGPGQFEAPTKAPAPELVDLKVTQRCPYEKDCGFCYMGSTTAGAHADPAVVMSALCALAELGVFEVALGGGEPTVWPHLGEVLRFCRSIGIVPNLTTKNYGYFRRHPDLLEVIGQVAFSVNDAAALAKLDTQLAAQWIDAEKLSIQCIPEVVPAADLEAIASWAAAHWARLTLLGYKESGRGGGFSGRIRRPPGFWIPLVQDHDIPRVAVDTVLAAQSAPALEAAGVPSWSYATSEGKFSMYLDAVAHKAGPSSYLDPASLDAVDLCAPVPDLSAQLTEVFASY